MSIPKTINEALSHPGLRQAMVEEMAALRLMAHEIWSLYLLASLLLVVGFIKVGADGQVDCLKARLVAKGYTQIYGSDYYDIFSPFRQDCFRSSSPFYDRYVLLVLVSVGHQECLSTW